MNEDPGRMDLVLGHSIRTAKSEIKRHKDCKMASIVSPSPRAVRRMDGEGITESFHAVGTTLTKLERLEIHFFSHGGIFLPMKALGLLLQNSKKLKFLLLNGMRLKGSVEDLVNLSNVFQNHPSLSRMSFFDIDSLDPLSVPLYPLLEGVRANPVIEDVALRYAGWASNSLHVMTDSDSQINVLRMSGKMTVDNDSGTAFPKMMFSLRSNTNLREITLHHSALPGAELYVAEMLRHNKHLQSIILELGHFDDAIPIASALERDNRTLKKIDLKIHNTDPERARPQIWTDINGNTARNMTGSLRNAATDHTRRGLIWGSGEDEDEEQDEELTKQRLNKLQVGFQRALESNTSLQFVRFITPGGARQESYNILLYCALNMAGRRFLLGDYVLPVTALLKYFAHHSQVSVTEADPVTPIDIIYSTLLLKPMLVSQLVEGCSKASRELPATDKKHPAIAFHTTLDREEEIRKQKHRFLMFTRVLMKYLDSKDPALHSKVKAIIKDCAERNKRQEPGYESVSASMREPLKQAVGDAYWKRAEAYLAHFLAQKQKQVQEKSSTAALPATDKKRPVIAFTPAAAAAAAAAKERKKSGPSVDGDKKRAAGTAATATGRKKKARVST